MAGKSIDIYSDAYANLSVSYRERSTGRLCNEVCSSKGEHIDVSGRITRPALFLSGSASWQAGEGHILGGSLECSSGGSYPTLANAIVHQHSTGAGGIKLELVDKFFSLLTASLQTWSLGLSADLPKENVRASIGQSVVVHTPLGPTTCDAELASDGHSSALLSFQATLGQHPIRPGSLRHVHESRLEPNKAVLDHNPAGRPRLLLKTWAPLGREGVFGFRICLQRYILGRVKVDLSYASRGEERGSREAWSVCAGSWGFDGRSVNMRLHKRSADPVKYDVGYNRGNWRAKTLGTLLKGVKVSLRLGDVKGFNGQMAALSDSDAPVLKLSVNLPKFGSAVLPISNLCHGSAHAGFYLPLN